MSYKSKDKKREYQRNYRQKYSERRKEYFHNYYHKHKQVWSKYRLYSQYGITIDDYNRMFEEQCGGCAICGIHQSKLKKALSVDHNHRTGQIRGLLCNKCNLLLGNASDNFVLLRSAADYLENYAMETE